MKMRRVVVYDNPSEYDRLAALMRSRGSDVSKWFREKREEELAKGEKECKSQGANSKS